METQYKISSFCSGGDCVEVGYRRSSFCAAGNCVEVATSPVGAVLVRDTKDRSKGPVQFSPGAWGVFLAGVKAGEFDID